MDTTNKTPRRYEDMNPAERFEERCTWNEGDTEIPYDPREDAAKRASPSPKAPPKIRKR